MSKTQTTYTDNPLLTCRDFQKSDYPAYKSWYTDTWLRQALGFPDEAWLNHILTTDEGSELAVFSGKELVAVVGITGALEGHDFRVITNIAVNPTLRKQGLGGKVMALLFEVVPLEKGVCWVAYVDHDNPGAQAFFIREGWARVEEEDMIRFECRAK